MGMTDLEKVIKGLNCCCHTDGSNCAKCPYDIANSDCTALMSMDAIPLVKKQLPMSPALKAPYYYCGACGQGIVGVERDGFGHAYCNVCGQKVKWDADD